MTATAEHGSGDAATGGPSPVTPYDVVHYPARSFEYTHPNRLATAATLAGMRPAPLGHCRVLELGCGVGGNIIPMAGQYPDSQYLGIDLSGDAIRAGRQLIANIGLDNIVLSHADILELDDDIGTFDYIICHGVYAWVPHAVREKILAIFKRHLAPQGIAYLSYNAHPYSHYRNMMREMMLFHVRSLHDPNKRVGQARAIARFLTESSDEKSVHGSVMRQQFKRISGMGDDVLFHDDLDENAEAFLLHEVVEAGLSYGLQYLGDVDFSRRHLGKYPDETRKILEGFPDSELLARDQYQDFIDGNGFRRTLFCQDGVALDRRIAPDYARHFFLATNLKPEKNESFNLLDESLVTFTGEHHDSLVIWQPLIKAAFYCLGASWPWPLTFDELADRTFAVLGERADIVRDDDTLSHLAQALSEAATSGEIAFRVERPDFAVTPGPKPEASRVARKQAEQSNIVTNLAHGGVRLDNELTRAFIQLLDGTRDLAQLDYEFSRLPKDNVPPDASLASILKSFASLALLVR